MTKTSCLFLATSLLAFACKQNPPSPPTEPAMTAYDRDEDPSPTYSDDDDVPSPSTNDSIDPSEPTDPAIVDVMDDDSDTTAANRELTDTSILAIATMIHQQEIDAGKLATSKASNAEVKAFAQMMVDDHTAALRQAKALAEKLGLSQTDEEATMAMKDEGDATKTRLDALDGAEFDRAYVDAQVTMHQNVLDRLDRDLIPAADDTQVRDLLTTQRTKVQAHLQHAQRVQGNVNKEKRDPTKTTSDATETQ